jgi:DNA invertase Pin-like site-specific DNA recombinase
MVQRYPIAYIRRSSADAANPGDVSREAQEQAVHELARREGHNGDLRILTDWDRSADESKESKRTAYVSMLAALERGEVSAIYAASLDRLYRSLRTFVRLTDAAKAHDVRIVTLREGVLGGDGSPMAQAFAQMTAIFSELELNTTKARAASAKAVLRDRGQYDGRVGYGYRFARTATGDLRRDDRGATIVESDPDHPLEPIIAAVREAGSLLGGCKLLQARGVPAPDGGTVWGSTTLRRIITRAAPELIPPPGPYGRRTPRHSALAQLLVCHCGHVLTPEPARHAYRCYQLNRTGSAVHGKGFVTESALLPYLRAEAARLTVPGDALEVVEVDASRAEAIRGRLARLTELYLDGLIDRERFDRDKAAAEGDLDAIESRAAIEALPPEIEWTWRPERLNAVLRSIWVSIQLDNDMRPERVDWRVPEWRA